MEFTLRPWRMEDAPTMARYAANPRIAANLRDAFPFPYPLADAEGVLHKNVCKTGAVHDSCLYAPVRE